jgi:hypothetical protein
MLPQLIQEYGSQERQDADETPARSDEKNVSAKAPELAADAEPDNSDNSKVGLMQAEERQTGGISWRTYIDYLRYGGGCEAIISGTCIFTDTTSARYGLSTSSSCFFYLKAHRVKASNRALRA